MKRRKSLDSSPTSKTPRIPHFIQQQIAAETKDSVLSSLNGWTSSEYNYFIEGLVAYSEEKDINIRCKLISDHYLPNFSPDEIKQCFTVLSNVAKSKEREESHDEFSIETRPKHFSPTMKTPEIPDIFNRFQIGNTRHKPNYLHEPYPMYPPFSPERRASFPMDSNFIKKHPEASDSFFDNIPLAWHNPNGSENNEFNHMDPHTQI